MGNSLADQLLKSGVVNKKQVKKAGKAKKHQKHLQQSGKVAVDDSIERQIKADEEAKRAKDHALEAEKKAIQEAKELRAQVAQLLKHHGIDSQGEAAYNYTLDGLVKQMLVSDVQRNQLVKGYVAIAHIDDITAMIPGPIAERINTRLPEAVIVWNKADESVDVVDEDDPYADYQIPDDLMW